MHLILLFVLSTYAQSKEVIVNYKLRNFKIDSTKDSIIYKAPKIELSIKKEKCNEHILKSIQAKLDHSLEGTYLDKPEKNFYTLNVEGVQKYDSITSKRAKFFERFEEEFKTLKIEEQLNCKK